MERAVATGREAATAVVVLDGFPSSGALRAMADVTIERPELSVLVLGPIELDVDILVALASGAFGYLPTNTAPEAVADAVAALLAGDAVLPRAVSLPLVHHLRLGGRGIVVSGPDGQATELTNREWEVLVLLRQARSTADIARQLVVSKALYARTWRRSCTSSAPVTAALWPCRSKVTRLLVSGDRDDRSLPIGGCSAGAAVTARPDRLTAGGATSATPAARAP